jgi:hypothetical protein
MLAGPLSEQRITVELVWPDGRPAVGEFVRVADSKGREAGGVSLDETGGATFLGSQNTAYVFWTQWRAPR